MYLIDYNCGQLLQYKQYSVIIKGINYNRKFIINSRAEGNFSQTLQIVEFLLYNQCSQKRSYSLFYYKTLNIISKIANNEYMERNNSNNYNIINFLFIIQGVN